MGFQRASGDAVLQHHAIQKLHSDERLLPMPTDFVDRADVGVVKGGSGACFTAKAFKGLRVLSYIRGQEFEGNEAAKLGIFGLIDDTHPAATQLLDDAVVRDG